MEHSGLLVTHRIPAAVASAAVIAAVAVGALAYRRLWSTRTMFALHFFAGTAPAGTPRMCLWPRPMRRFHLRQFTGSAPAGPIPTSAPSGAILPSSRPSAMAQRVIGAIAVSGSPGLDEAFARVGLEKI